MKQSPIDALAAVLAAAKLGKRPKAQPPPRAQKYKEPPQQGAVFIPGNP